MQVTMDLIVNYQKFFILSISVVIIDNFLCFVLCSYDAAYGAVTTLDTSDSDVNLEHDVMVIDIALLGSYDAVAIDSIRSEVITTIVISIVHLNLSKIL